MSPKPAGHLAQVEAIIILENNNTTDKAEYYTIAIAARFPINFMAVDAWLKEQGWSLEGYFSEFLESFTTKSNIEEHMSEHLANFLGLPEDNWLDFVDIIKGLIDNGDPSAEAAESEQDLPSLYRQFEVVCKAHRWDIKQLIIGSVIDTMRNTVEEETAYDLDKSDLK